MKKAHHTCVVALLATLSAMSPVLQAGSTASSNATQAWTSLQTLAKPSQTSGSTGNLTLTQVKANRTAQAVQYRQAAEAAKAYYTNYPDEANAVSAKKIEVVTGLLGVTDDNATQEKSALETATTYRNNKSYAAEDRFDVALLIERTKARSSLGGSASGNDPETLAKIAETLRTEFGDIPKVYYYYVSVARMADMTTANSIATKLLAWSATPTEAKTEAQEIVDRQSMVGKTLDVQLTTIDGKTFDLGQQSGKLTILYVWSMDSGAANLSGLTKMKKTLPSDAQVVYLSLGSTAAEVVAVKAKATVSGTYCYDTSTKTNRLTDSLKLRHTPYVYVLNRQGKLSGFGTVSDLSTLLTAASK